MKPIFKKVDSKSEEAFVARIDQFAQFYNKWHYHPELELTHIVKGSGTRFVGDNIEFFQNVIIEITENHRKLISLLMYI